MTTFTDAHGFPVRVRCLEDSEAFVEFPAGPAGPAGPSESRVAWEAERSRLAAICRRCLALASCRELALSVEVAGFAAGMTAAERLAVAS